jgi:hypothetical protein
MSNNLDYVPVIQNIFPQDQMVVRFTKSDFYLGTATPIAIRQKLPVVIMFYLPNEVGSLHLGRIFRETAKRVSQFIFTAVDASSNGEREVMQAFALNADSDGPLSEFKIDGFPTILVYRRGWPKAFYDGPWNVGALQNWLLRDAIRQNYKQTTLTHHGVLPFNLQTPADRQQAALLNTQSYQYTTPLFQEVDARPVTQAAIDSAKGEAIMEENRLLEQIRDQRVSTLNVGLEAQLGGSQVNINPDLIIQRPTGGI